LIAYRATKVEVSGTDQFATKADAEVAYLASALMVMSKANTLDPNEYARFRNFVGA